MNFQVFIRPIISRFLINAVLILFFLPFSFFAQVKNIGLPDVQNYKKSDYKGGTQNWNIDQDKNGNIYFANNSGLLQFNGSQWTTSYLPNRSAIRSLKVDSSGRIYVGGYNEFGYFAPDKKGKLNYFSVAKLVNENNINLIDFIWKIHVFEGEVFFQSFARVYIYKDNKLRILEAPNRFQFSFVVKNKMYFQDSNLGLMEYSDGHLTQLKGSTVINDTEVWGLFQMSAQHLLVATLDKGLFVYDGEKMLPWDTEANGFVKKNSSLGGVMINDKFIVLNSVLNGLIICDKNGNIIQHINRKKGLQNNTVLSSFIDINNNLWLGLDNGIAFVNENSPFTYFGFSYDLSTVYASVVFNGNLYVATNQGVFYHSWNENFREDSFSLVEGTTGQAWNLQVIDGQLLCGHNRGALVISGDKVVSTLDNNGYFGFKPLPNHPGFIIGSKYNGFSLFEKNSLGWRFKTHISGFDKSASTYEIDNMNLWLKKDNLVYQMLLSNDLTKFKSIKTYKSISPSLNGIGTIQKINGRVYFQTNNKFFKYSQEEDLFFLDKKVTSLFENIPPIRALSEDRNGNIWYVFNESLGVLKKNSSGNYTNNLTQFANLTGNIVYEYLSINTLNPNNIFIGMTEGLAHYDSGFQSDLGIRPKAFIQSFSTASDTLFLGNMQRFDEFKIPYSSNNVRFSFSSPTYENLQNVEYSYQLEGFEEKWSNWSTMSVKEYTNLREGDYSMNVKVRNSYGIQSETRTVNFTVLPPFYRNFLAYAFYVVLIVVAVYYTRQQIRMKIRKNKYYETIEQRRLYLEKESKIRQEQYELEKEIERLKSDKLQVKILTKDKELVNNSLQVVKKNKILNGIIHKLKDIDVESIDESTKSQINKLNKSISKEVNTDKSWKDLEKHIKNVHFDFLKRLKEKYPTISPRELDLSTYLLMNMSTKEIAEIMNISSGGVELARYRLRKKLELNKKENLTGFLMSI